MKRFNLVLGWVAFVLVLTFSNVNPVCAADEAKEHEHFKTKEQCLSCHGKKDYSITKESETIPLFLDAEKFGDSVHGEFECKVCHTESAEHVYGQELTDRISQRCANCHTGAAYQLGRGVHSGDKEGLPNCVSCHGNHYIQPKGDKTSAVSGSNLASTCAEECHTTEYKQFKESFHGKAAALGGKNAPSCITCHGSHRILSKENPADITNPENKYLLCGKCHDGRTLGVGTVEHYEVKPQGYGRPMYLVKSKMPWLIILVMTVFLGHTILDLLHRIRKVLAERRR